MVTALPARAAFRWKILVLAFIVAISGAFAASENSEIAKRRAGERRTFSDGEILDGFFKITFGAEFHVAGRVDRIRKYDTPVRIFIDNRAAPDRSKQVADAITDIRSPRMIAARMIVDTGLRTPIVALADAEIRCSAALMKNVGSTVAPTACRSWRSPPTPRA